MDDLVTIRQAQKLIEIGFNEPTVRYAYKFIKTYKLQQTKSYGINIQNIPNVLGIPTVDEVIDWLRRKHNIIIANKSIPFVDPLKNKISFNFVIKWCNLRDGWNGRVIIGHTGSHTNIYAAKRIAIWKAIRYIEKTERERSKHRKLPTNTN